MDKETKSKFDDVFIDLGRKMKKGGRPKEYIALYYEAMQDAVEEGLPAIPEEVHQQAQRIALEEGFYALVKEKHPDMPEEEAWKKASELVDKAAQLAAKGGEKK